MPSQVPLTVFYLLIFSHFAIMSAASSLIRVFVYGTLKRGQPNHYLLTDGSNGFSKFIANATTSEKFPLVVATRYNIPFLLHRAGVGELSWFKF
jgi:gamma-glutamylaminecyclotransferase